MNARMNASRKNVALQNAQKNTENANRVFAYAAFSDHWEKSSQTTATAATVQGSANAAPWEFRKAKAHAERPRTAQRTQVGTSDFFASVQLQKAATATLAAVSAWGANSSIRYPG